MTAVPVMSTIPLPASPIVVAIRAMYGFAQGIELGIDDLIDKMKRSENSTISRSGTVLEGAKYGFGIGYITSVIIIAVGQIILGNPLSAVVTIGTGVVLSNPIAMTCGAIGAIYYGWRALSEEERDRIVNRLMEAFEVGSELIRAMVGYVLKTTKELLSAENIAEFKRFITESANAFGHTLSDVTKAVVDTVSDTVDTVATKTKKSVSDARDYIKNKVNRTKAPEPLRIENDKE